MRKIFKLFLAFYLITPFINAAEYSFEQAYQRALSSDEELIAAKKEVERFKATRNATRGLYFRRR